MTLYLGSHMSISKGLKKAVLEAEKNGSNALQIFAKSPQSTRYKCKFKDDELAEVKRTLAEKDMQLVIHSSYMLNFAKPPEEVKWAVDSLVEDMPVMGKLAQGPMTMRLLPGERVIGGVSTAAHILAQEIVN